MAYNLLDIYGRASLPQEATKQDGKVSDDRALRRLRGGVYNITTLTANRVIIAVLFLMLLGFIAVPDRSIRRLQDRERELTDRLDELTRQLQAHEESSTELEAQHSGETP